MILQSAKGALAAVRALEDRLRDADYLSWGKRSNADLLTHDDDDLFDELREEASLEDVLDVPFALQRVKDLRAALQLAVSRVGESRDELTRNPRFHAVFASFAYGFATGLVVAHRAKAAKTTPDRVSRRAYERCEEWALLVVLYYLVVVDARGIIDKRTDYSVYGIADHWRSIAHEHVLEPTLALRTCVEVGERAGARWSTDESMDVGAALIAALESVITSRPVAALA